MFTLPFPPRLQLDKQFNIAQNLIHIKTASVFDKKEVAYQVGKVSDVL